jgi:hypothetical protein
MLKVIEGEAFYSRLKVEEKWNLPVETESQQDSC